jgi:hypothetical protein
MLKEQSMSTTSTTGIIPRDQTPYFVIHGDECCLTWLIKQIMLIFQSCRQQDTIDTYITSFSSTNIRWLSQSQIEGLPVEKIAQLGTEQLTAFTDVQISYFTSSQLAIFEAARRPPVNLEPISLISSNDSTDSLEEANSAALVDVTETLDQMTVAEALQLSPDQASFLSLKLNGCLEEEYLGTEVSDVDENAIDTETISSLTVRQLRSLTTEKINSLLSGLAPQLTALLSPPQLRGLNTTLLLPEQVNALFEEPSNYAKGKKSEHLLSIFSGDQIKDMQSKLAGNILRGLHPNQIKAIKTNQLSSKQIDDWINLGDYSYVLGNMYPNQILNLGSALTGQAYTFAHGDHELSWDDYFMYGN